MVQERRLSQRKTFERLTYIDLPHGNGGIVTDVSEGGLGFQAVSPVESCGPIQFSIAVTSGRITGTGNLVWIDQKKKVGGLRFTELPDTLQEQIRNWPSRSNLRLVSGAGSNSNPDLRTTEILAEIMPRATSAARIQKDFFSESSWPESRPGKRSPFLKVVGVSGLAGMIGVLSYLCYREAREWLADSNTGAQRDQISQTLAPPSAAPSSSEVALLQNAAEKPANKGASPVGVANAAASDPPAIAQIENAHSRETQAPVLHESTAAEPEILFVQVAALTNEAEAFKLVDTLGQQHFSALISPPVSDRFYRVQLGPYQTAEAARAALKNLEKAGYRPFVRH